MINSISITIIADNISKAVDIDLLKEKLSAILPEETIHQSTNAYTKFHDAYKMEFAVPVAGHPDKEKRLYLMASLAESIARPWLLYFDKEGDNTELIFNRDEHTQLTQAAFHPIRWAHIQLIY
jgi:hypothetical protein